MSGLLYDCSNRELCETIGKLRLEAIERDKELLELRVALAVANGESEYDTRWRLLDESLAKSPLARR